MANVWGANPLILDTAANDTSYDKTHDVIDGEMTGDPLAWVAGTEYSSMTYKIKKIIVNGDAADQVTLNQCKTSDVEGAVFFDYTLQTGETSAQFDFPGGLLVKGIYPSVISSGTTVYVYLY